MAVVALVLYLVGVFVAFGLKSYFAWRRTGDTGFRRPQAAAFTGAWWGYRLFVLALLISLMAPVLGVAGLWQIPVTVEVAGAGIVVMAVGLVFTLMSQTAMGTSWRIGVDSSETTDLVTSGVFGVVRNPVFTGMGVVLVGLVAVVPSPVAALALVSYALAVQLQVRAVEEPYLLATHPEDYGRYAAQVGRFVPGLGRVTRVGG
ncbi:isoprenylcysteine carboxylmethyltransferase family protein [Spiractinospora alimapuensis]|uniref:methyltransferase family protein n=1 Tax=Spiractinospora alimapuensis TaxID=2820884 RepID=UPI001F1D585D|nr:isoprenylcysteine carboxylmethyltransferase family protein [Spiractinospora alimapuensis]QVQ53774.1 isoprenylcysteine carboxylmethyltransferase family protein [Spiractinospora alimapuensis]